VEDIGQFLKCKIGYGRIHQKTSLNKQFGTISTKGTTPANKRDLLRYKETKSNRKPLKKGLAPWLERLTQQEYVRYFSDEMRYGLISNFRRSWSRVGERTILDSQQAFDNRYLFTAVANSQERVLI
jgi:hypothetical protein